MSLSSYPFYHGIFHIPGYLINSISSLQKICKATGSGERGGRTVHREQDDFSLVLEQCQSIVFCLFFYSGVKICLYNANLDTVHCSSPLSPTLPPHKKTQLDIYQCPEASKQFRSFLQVVVGNVDWIYLAISI